ncbi:MAG: hypothetical protein HN572_08005, partial [Kordiimonadaceae bacterium]|nr:hypothetical protein [Kordiimonadaceae bacterium]
MKIGSQSQTLVALTSLLDAAKPQQQVQGDEQGEKDKKTQGARDGRLSARKAQREDLIQQNRDAL